MKLSFSLLASLLLASQAIALPTFETEVDRRSVIPTPVANPPASPVACAAKNLAVPFYSGFSLSAGDHFYTTNTNELATKQGYAKQNHAGSVFTTQQPGTIPLYRLYNGSQKDHVYTTNVREKDNLSRSGYAYEGIACYLYEGQYCGSTPLYRLYNQTLTDHFYTTNWKRADAVVDLLKYKYEGIAGYVLP